MKKKVLIKLVFVSLLAMSAFHLSGIEAAFCDDGVIAEKASSHGCSICQPGTHSVSMDHSVVTFADSQEPLFFLELPALRLKDPARFIFHPPISL